MIDVGESVSDGFSFLLSLLVIICMVTTNKHVYIFTYSKFEMCLVGQGYLYVLLKICIKILRRKFAMSYKRT